MLEAIFAVIGAWFLCALALAAIAAIYVTLARRRDRRRGGGLLDLTPAPDDRKNARDPLVLNESPAPLRRPS